MVLFRILSGHRARTDDRDPAHAFDQYPFSDRLSELGLEGFRRIRDQTFPPFAELHPSPLQQTKIAPDGTSAFSPLGTG